MSAKGKRELRRILLAAAVLLILMLLDGTGILKNAGPFRLPLYLVPYLICGLPVLRKAALGIKNRQVFDESFLMMIATVGAFVTGEYPEAAAVMLFYQVGEWFQSYAVERSRRSISELMEIVPEYAIVVDDGGAEETVDPDEVSVGDILRIRPGDRIPVDGTVLSGTSTLQTAALTGESIPRTVREGDPVISGCINGEGLLTVRAEKAFEDSTVSRILELVETAAEKKSRIEKFITRFARYYTPAVVLAALALALVPPLFLGSWRVWVYRACAFLVISCPCALVISVPLAFFGGVGAAGRAGVLVKGSDYLEQLSKLHTVVSDKTGTVTEGSFTVSEVLCAEGTDRETVLEAASRAEGASTHPIAASIREALGRDSPLPAAEDIVNHPGLGVCAVSEGRQILVGSGRLMEEYGVDYNEAEDPGATVCYVAVDGVFLGAILIRDRLKKEAGEAFRGMRTLGVEKLVLLTGDRAAAGESAAGELGVDAVYSELLPQHKVEKVEELLRTAAASGGSLAFVGDGINDAPVLARSDVGIAMGSLGSDAAIEAADVVIMDDDLTRIPLVMKIARRTVAIARQNIVFALSVKFAILALSAVGHANMWTAVFADVGVAVLCILNSMRLLAVKARKE